MIVVGFNPKITWQVTCQFFFWCWKINNTLQLSFQRNVTLNLFYLWWSFNGQCYLDMIRLFLQKVYLFIPHPYTPDFYWDCINEMFIYVLKLTIHTYIDKQKSWQCTLNRTVYGIKLHYIWMAHLNHNAKQVSLFMSIPICLIIYLIRFS